MSAVKPKLWNPTEIKKLDEETAYAICRLIGCVGYQIKEKWDWEWLEKKRGSYRSLLNPSLMNAAWDILAGKDWLSLQTVNDQTKRITTITPLEGLTDLRSLVLQNNL